MSGADQVHSISHEQKSFVILTKIIFSHGISPLRNSPNIAVRHYILQVLGLLLAITPSLAIDSYTFLAASIVGHALLIGAMAITVAVLSTATVTPELFLRSSRRQDGEHE